MTTVLRMPEVAESVVEGTVARWLKREGDRITEYEPLVEIVTDKVTVEIPSPADGILSKIVAQPDSKVAVGGELAHIEEEARVGAQGASSRPAPESALDGPGVLTAAFPGVSSPRPEANGGRASAAPHPAPAAHPAPIPSDGGAHISPLARRLASEHGIDLAAIQGTGLGGRVRKQDILEFAARKQQMPRGVSSQPVSTVPAAAPVVAPALPQAQLAARPGDTRMPLSPVRAMIAQHLVQSMREVPHAWTSFQVDVTKLVALRDSWKDKFRAAEGVPLTYTPFFIKAVVEGLKYHPTLNSVWGGDHILLKKDINISVAIGRDEGLIVPTLRNADRHSIAGLAHELDRLIQRARENKLALDDVQGGTFTVNNTGSIGSVISQPIVNYPQTAILATEAIVKQPVVVGDAIAIRSMMNLSISFDHRVLDGGQVGKFMQAVKRGLEAYGPESKVY